MYQTARSMTFACSMTLAVLLLGGACTPVDGGGDADADEDADARFNSDADDAPLDAEGPEVEDADPNDAANDTADGDGDGESGDADLPLGPFLHVRAVDGIDAPSAGSAESPFLTIQYAIDNAAPPVAVLVAAGSYEDPIVLREGVSLYGAFSDSDWSDRDVLGRDDPSHAAVVEATLNTGIVGGMGITPDTVVEGLVVRGGYDDHDHHSYGIYLYDGASPTIRHNTIYGGTGDTYGNGIGLFGSSAVIVGNVIRGGDAEIVYGIRSGNESTPLIASNFIVGETAADVSYGIMLVSSSPRILGNTIDGGSGASESYGIFHFGASSPAIEGNVIFTRGGAQRVGIFEFAPFSTPASLRRNDIFDCPTALYRDYDSTRHELTSIDAVNALTDVEAEGNISLDAGFSVPDDCHLGPASPTQVLEGGLDLSSEGFDIDVDGEVRTVPWAIGADELDAE